MASWRLFPGVNGELLAKRLFTVGCCVSDEMALLSFIAVGRLAPAFFPGGLIVAYWVGWHLRRCCIKFDVFPPLFLIDRVQI
jgi:hypothetical protein